MGSITGEAESAAALQLADEGETGQQLAQKGAKVTKCRRRNPELMLNGALGDGKEMTAAIMRRR